MESVKKSALPMDTRTTRGVTDALPFKNEYLINTKKLNVIKIRSAFTI